MHLEELQKLIAQGEDETLELKARIPQPALVARYLASMANNRGGHLVLGVKEPAVYVGVNPDRAIEVLSSAALLLTPVPQITATSINFDEKYVVVASVKRSSVLISALGGYYTRVGHETQAFTAEGIKHHALDERSPDIAISELSAAIAAQTITIEKLNSAFEKENSILKKGGIAVGGAIAGVIAKHLIDIWLD
jgi:predicted HTH transcriptional regulator